MRIFPVRRAWKLSWQSCGGSAMDFNAALARLLRDGALREAFRRDPGGVVGALALSPRRP
jgi:hypothetical protein